ncbi:hypothetical protein ACT7CV_05405 [Bacillus paranthracis]
MEKLKDTSKLFTVNKEAFEEMAAELKFFKNSEKVYKNYEKEVAKIEEQKAQLETELTRLMTEQVKLVKELELFKDDVSQVVYLRREMKKHCGRNRNCTASSKRSRGTLFRIESEILP